MGRTRAKSLRVGKKTEAELPYEPPVWLGPLSNGEFFRPATRRDLQLKQEILRRADEFARRVGMDRREFMISAMGMATTLSIFNLASGCGKDGFHSDNAAGDFASPPGTRARGTSASAAMSMRQAEERGSDAGNEDASSPDPGGRDSEPLRPMATDGRGGDPAAGMAGDGGFMVSPDTCMNAEMADRLFKKDYFIVDAHTSHAGNQGCLCGPSPCGVVGTSEVDFIRFIFGESDTAVAIATAMPGSLAEDGTDLGGSFNTAMLASRDKINKGFAPGADRMLVNCQVDPFAGHERNGAMMERFSRAGISGWSCHTAIGDMETGWFLTDDVGVAFVEKAIELKIPRIAVHKGLPLGPTWSRKHADPMPDVGKIAARFPEVSFVVYDSAIDGAHDEGPYVDDPDPLRGGSDRLAKAVSDAGVRGKNVYADMGTVWIMHLRDPVRATHYLGKMLKYVGEERLLWSTQAPFFGRPQCQIDAMKAFKMDSGLRDMYQYPDLDDALKRKMFGLSAAAIYGIDPDACRYQLDMSQIALHKQVLDHELGERRWALNNRPLIRSLRDFRTWRALRRAGGRKLG